MLWLELSFNKTLIHFIIVFGLGEIDYQYTTN